jgi:hypothetical protein
MLVIPLTCHIYRQWVGSGQMTDIFTCALFLWRDKYLQILVRYSSHWDVITSARQILVKCRRNKTNEMHIQSKVNHIFRISMLLLRVSALYERHLQGAQGILMKLCACYVVSAKIEIKYTSWEYIRKYVKMGTSVIKILIKRGKRSDKLRVIR